MLGDHRPRQDAAPTHEVFEQRVLLGGDRNHPARPETVRVEIQFQIADHEQDGGAAACRRRCSARRRAESSVIANGFTR